MVSSGVTFGTVIPQGYKRELRAYRNDATKWSRVVEVAQLAENLGYDDLWVLDHFHNAPLGFVPDNPASRELERRVDAREPKPLGEQVQTHHHPTGKPDPRTTAPEAVFECLTTLAAISQQTTRIRLGLLVMSVLFRHPSLVAKLTSNLDVISGGRLEWGIGAGWWKEEAYAYGYNFPPLIDRIRMMGETVEIVKSMWTQPACTYNGRFFRVEGARCEPKPIQKPHPPVLIGGQSEGLMMKIVAHNANASNFRGAPELWAHKCEVLKTYCDEVGRDYDEITKTWAPELYIHETEKELRADWKGHERWQVPLEVFAEVDLVGTPEQVAEKIQRYVDLGCRKIITHSYDAPNDHSLRLFAQKVIPEFR